VDDPAFLPLQKLAWRKSAPKFVCFLNPSDIVSAMLIAVLALAMMHDVCPITIGVGSDGRLYSDRFHGWYRITPRTLNSDLRGGCYNDNNPSPVTSVNILIAPGAPKPKTDEVFSILEKEGWSREKVTVKSWDQYPQGRH
jgi:hypothetical protein